MSRKKEEKRRKTLLASPPPPGREIEKNYLHDGEKLFFWGVEAKSAAGGSRICTSKRRVEGREGKAAESLEVEMEGRPISSLNLSLSLPPPAAVTTSNSWLYRSFSQLPGKFRKFILLFFFDFCHNVPPPLSLLSLSPGQKLTLLPFLPFPPFFRSGVRKEKGNKMRREAKDVRKINDGLKGQTFFFKNNSGFAHCFEPFTTKLNLDIC